MQTAKTIPATQVKNNFGMIVNQIHNGEFPEVIVENHGEPIVAIIPISQLKAVKDYKEQERQKEALAKLRSVRARIQARIKGKLTDKDAGDLANRFSRDFIKDLEKDGKIKFETRAS